MGILIQNNFRSATNGEKSVSHITAQRTYTELHEKVVPTGIVQEYAEVEYPHTPERIKSYSDIADYKKDPYAAIMRGESSGKVNLGDIREIQRFQNMDKTQRAEYLAKVKSAIATLEEAEKVVEPVVEPVKVDTNPIEGGEE